MMSQIPRKAAIYTKDTIWEHSIAVYKSAAGAILKEIWMWCHRFHIKAAIYTKGTLEKIYSTT